MTDGPIGGIGIDSCSKVSIEMGASWLREILSVVTKGQQLVYGRTPVYFVSVDLSNNSLTGEIPTGITSLFALMNLNLPSKKIEWTSQTWLELCSHWYLSTSPRITSPEKSHWAYQVLHLWSPWTCPTTICVEGYPLATNLTSSTLTSRHLCTSTSMDFVMWASQ